MFRADMDLTRVVAPLHMLKLLMLLLVATLASPSTVVARGLGFHVLFDLTTPTGSPFPSDRFTVPDPDQNTGLRVNLPKPDCASHPSECADLTVINTLDGFHVQPRVSIPFSAPIDVNTASSRTVFLVNLGDTLSEAPPSRRVTGINQIVWDVATTTLHAYADELLDQHTRYLLVVTRGIRDVFGRPLGRGAFERFLHDPDAGPAADVELKAYRHALVDALAASGLSADEVAAASLFTTQSTTAFLEKVRDQIKAGASAPATFLLGPGGTRSVFPLATMTSLVNNRQTATTEPMFTSVNVPIQFLGPSVRAIAFGKFLSPNYQVPGEFIPPMATRTGAPAVQGINEVFVNVFLPDGPMPLAGWPVAIFQHGGAANKNGTVALVAGPLAARGIATVAINAVGAAFGPLGTLTINRTDGPPVTIPAGGRGIDQDGNGTITITEGSSAAPPYDIVIAGRDGTRQTVIDLLQLVRVIEVGVDVDADGVPDLDASRIYFFGQSAGANAGAVFLAVEPSIRAGVLNVGGAPVLDAIRLGLGGASGNRDTSLGIKLANRVPSLINVGGVKFDENIPLRNQPVVINTVPGAMELQTLFDRAVWAVRSGDPAAFAPYIRRIPSPEMAPKAILFQFAKGDSTGPNPTQTNILRAGDLAQQTVYFRNDLAIVTHPGLPKNPHLVLFPTDAVGTPLPAKFPFAFAVQAQIAAFFASDGTEVIPPPGVEEFFEIPIVGPLPEELNYLP
jgi:hypothetical protein